ncbi:IclR family transcriptional regulator [Mangrovihabitans endophyticus]|uniref:Glycerol operon regulatory protein n=1 Tax=Mangrovihabitans endophyticus TaxID=1751298 RepID=A0A8J3BVC6_9ACTN|nr:IclR family transcriptional regulator [Mangrovihabitans endophyticus]GGK77075.1 IclR family transcriptional regulator [Mangrovihabitans endophyticus]
MSNSGEVQSVDRAVTVLEILADRGEAGVTELAAELGVHKSTASRLVGALVQRGLVEQNGERGRYRLGLGMVRLAGAAASRIDLPQVAQPICEMLAGELGETVNVAVLDDRHAVNVCQGLSQAAIGSFNWVGRRTPLHATSSGKVLLAFCADRPRDLTLAKFTGRTVTDAGRLAEQLDEIRARGWGTTSEELEIGLNAVAAPVLGTRAAISASGPSFRLTTDKFPAYGQRLVSGAAQISASLGVIA